MEKVSTTPTTSAEFLNANRSVDRETEEELFMLASHAMDQGTADADLESEAVQLLEEKSTTLKGDVENDPASQVSRKTIVQTTWSTGLWTTWAKQRMNRPQDGEESKHELLTDIKAMKLDDLAFWLGNFILEVRRQKDGKPYPVDTLCNVVGGLNRSLKFSGREENFLKDPVFSRFREIFEKEKKRLRSVASRNNSSDIATDSPQVLHVPRFPKAAIPNKSVVQEKPSSQQVKEVICSGKWGEADNPGVSGVAKKTLAQTAWCSRIWSTWAKQRMELPLKDTEEMQHPLLADFKSMPANNMAFWLRKFILEIRRTDGGTYSPESLSNILAGLGRLLKYSGRADIDLMRDSAFSCCREVRDTVLCQLRSSGNYPRKSATIIGPDEENTLWEKGLLGDHNAQVLIDTLVYYIGYCFGVRGGHHRKLRHRPSQLELFEPPGAVPYLVYTEDASDGSPQRNKLVLEMNIENPKRCLVRLYQLYNSKCPMNRPDDAFYLRPLSQPKGNVWYDTVPVGHNVLCGTIHRLFTSAGMKGNYTHNSLRVASANRLHFSGLDEHQIAQAYTRDIVSTGIHSYKRVGKRGRGIPPLLSFDPDVADVSDISSGKTPQNSYETSQEEIDEQAMDESQTSGARNSGTVVNATTESGVSNVTPENVGSEEIPHVGYTKQSSFGSVVIEPEIVYIEDSSDGLGIADQDTESIESPEGERFESENVLDTGVPEIARSMNFQQERARNTISDSESMDKMKIMNQEYNGSDSGQDGAGNSHADITKHRSSSTGIAELAGAGASISSVSTLEAAGLGSEYFVSNTEEIEGGECNVDQDFHSPEPEEIPPSQSSSRRFSTPVTSEYVLESTNNKLLENSSTSQVPQRTIVQTAWCTGIWSTWAIQRRKRSSADSEEEKHQLLPDITAMAADDIAFWLMKFILEIRRADGKPYSPDSIYSIFAGLNRGLKYSGRPEVSLMRDSRFLGCRDVLEAEMVRLHNTGQFSKKSVTVISAKEENILWEKGILGDHNPQALIDTLIYFFGYYFSICGGEHRKLRHEPSQIQLFEPPDGLPYLTYTEDATSGKLKRLKKRSVYMNVDNPERCLVSMYKLYNSKCPKIRPRDAFYLRPLTDPKGDIWYENTPVGHNYLSKTIPRLFKRAGIEGNYTNLSLRGATRTAALGSVQHDQSSKRRSERTNKSQSPISGPLAARPPMKRQKLASDESQAEFDQRKADESDQPRDSTPPLSAEDDSVLATATDSNSDSYTGLETGPEGTTSETNVLEPEDPRMTFHENTGMTRFQNRRLKIDGQNTVASQSDRLGASIVTAILKNFGIDTSSLESLGLKSTELECIGTRNNTDPKSFVCGTPGSRITTEQNNTSSLGQGTFAGNRCEDFCNSASDSIEVETTPSDITEPHLPQPNLSDSQRMQQSWSNVGKDPTAATVLHRSGPPIIITGGLTINFNFK